MGPGKILTLATSIYYSHRVHIALVFHSVLIKFKDSTIKKIRAVFTAIPFWFLKVKRLQSVKERFIMNILFTLTKYNPSDRRI